ncbi:MAG: PQQ-binding-like beta-propeller repeat protein [Flavobacteriales bacterium]|nr:PQQ-binding-like beta-propeller repeat protein [Flavobacteriales bacterium]
MRVLKTVFTLALTVICLWLSGQNTTADTLRVAVLADLHVSVGNAQDKNLSQVIENINASDYDFVIVDGDVSTVGSNEELTNVKNKLSLLNKPYFFVPGNHETNWSESACQKINDLWGTDRFVYEVGDYIFIGYSTGPYIKMGDGAVRKEDIIWLDNELSKRYKIGKKVVSVAHYPLGEGLSNYKDVVNVLKKYNTILHINGHHHTYALKNYDGIVGFMAPTLIGKPDTNAVYSSLTFTPDNIKIQRHQEVTGFVADKKGWTVPQSGDRSNVGEVFDGVYHAPMNDDVKVPFSYQETASMYTGVCFPTKNSIAYGTSEGQVKCLDIKTKQILWETPKTTTIYSTPFVSGKAVIIGRINGDVEAYNAKDGKKLWSFNIGSPVVQEGIADDKGFGYIGGSFGEFAKFNCKDGKIVWNEKIGSGLMQGRPTIYEDKIIFGCWDKNLYCVDRNSGKMLWRWTNGKNQKLYSPGNVVPAVSHEKVFVVAPDRYMTAVSLADGKEIWRTNLHTVRESMCLSKDGDRVYAKTMNDVLICVSTASQDYKLLWATDIKYGYEHTPCPPVEAKNGLVFLTNRRGQVFAVDGKTGTAKWAFDAGNSAANKIVEGPDGRVWITLIEGRILSIEPMEIL